MELVWRGDRSARRPNPSPGETTVQVGRDHGASARLSELAWVFSTDLSHGTTVRSAGASGNVPGVAAVSSSPDTTQP